MGFLGTYCRSKEKKPTLEPKSLNFGERLGLRSWNLKECLKEQAASFLTS